VSTNLDKINIIVHKRVIELTDLAGNKIEISPKIKAIAKEMRMC